MNTSLRRVRAVIGVLCSLTTTWAAVAVADEAPPPRPVVEVEERPWDKAKAYRALFEKVGRAGLTDLAKDKDTSLALQASWELHKKLVKRDVILSDSPPPSYLPKDTYDADEIKKFLTFLKDRTKAPVPEWWAKGISDLSVQVEKVKCHLYFGIDPLRKELNPVDLGVRVWRVREGVKLTLRDDVYSYKSGDVLIECPKAKNPGDFFGGGCLADVSGEKITCLAPYSSTAAFRFRVAGFESKSGKRLWQSEVWALARTIHAGPSAGHRVELTTKGRTVFVFGEEVGGFYLEAFDLETGKCQFRFCTSYWGHYSEAWDLKPGD
jgi:hypothetical protein